MDLQKVSTFLFSTLVAIFATLYFVNETLYIKLTSEDHVVEWLTFLFLILSGVLSASLAIVIKDQYNYYHWFFVLFAAFCIFAGLEEISWGQRVFGVESTEFFKKHSDKQEINLHNMFQGTVGIKTEHIALLVMLIYGVILPLLDKNKSNTFTKWLKEHYLVIPPVFLIPAFLIAAILMLNFLTGQEEEIGEFLFSVCFFLMILWNYSFTFIKGDKTFQTIRDEPLTNQ